MISLVDKFPTDLDSLYRRLWDRVNQQRGSKRLLAHAVLEFLTFAERPVTLDCMKRIIGKRTQSAGLYADDLDVPLILHACHSMVVYDQRLDTVRLAHLTARHYLMKTLNGQLSHAWLAVACLQELLLIASRPPNISEYADLTPFEAVRMNMPVSFTIYAAMSWHYHSHNGTQTQEYQEAESAFLHHETAPCLWIRILYTEDGIHTGRLRTLLGFIRAYPNTVDNLFLAACFFGLNGLFVTTLMSGQINIGKNITIPSFEGIRRRVSWVGQFTEIHKLKNEMRDCVGMKEHEIAEKFPYRVMEHTPNIARLLGDVRCAGAICAAEQGHKKLFKKILDNLLLQNPPPPPQLLWLIHSCRYLASAGRHLGVLEVTGIPATALSLQATSPFSFLGGSLLGLSAFLGSVEMLLYWKQKLVYLDENMATKDLFHAVRRDDERATRLLIENLQVDINHRRSHGSDWNLDAENTPLMAAAARGFHRTIKALLRHPDIDVNLRDFYGNTPLMLAGSGLAVAALCKDRDLNIHLRNSLGETALEIFVKVGDTHGIQELAKHRRFDVNQRNRWNETPLITAVRLREVQVVEVLLQIPSIDLEARDEDGLSALEIANRMDHEPLKISLSKKGDVNLSDYPFYMWDLLLRARPKEDLSRALIRHPESWT